MRILHVSTRLILGGSQENTVLSCEWQARAGHDVHLAFGPIYGPEGSLLERVQNFRAAPAAGQQAPGDGARITTHVVPHLVREVRPRADLLARRELRRLISSLAPDVVHTHSSKAGILGRLAAWAVNRDRRGLPPCAIVHTIHGPPFMPIDGGPVRRAKLLLTNAAYAAAERLAARRCHTIVSVADAMTREFLARGIGVAAQYVTVRSGVDLEPYLHPPPSESRDAVRAALGLAADDFVIGTVARLAEHKGHDDLLDALGDELPRRPGWKLLWVGDGWWRDRLLARVKALGISDRVVTTGLVPPERVPGLIRAMDVLAHPSYREGLPRTVTQALLCGVVPVAYDADGTGEICRDMQTGRLVAVGDRRGLRDAILWLAQHPARRQELADRGRASCEQGYSADLMGRRLDEVYGQALTRSRSRR